jgi:hypothetical protein
LELIPFWAAFELQLIVILMTFCASTEAGSTDTHRQFFTLFLIYIVRYLTTLLLSLGKIK